MVTMLTGPPWYLKLIMGGRYLLPSNVGDEGTVRVPTELSDNEVAVNSVSRKPVALRFILGELFPCTIGAQSTYVPTCSTKSTINATRERPIWNPQPHTLRKQTPETMSTSLNPCNFIVLYEKFAVQALRSLHQISQNRTTVAKPHQNGGCIDACNIWQEAAPCHLEPEVLGLGNLLPRFWPTRSGLMHAPSANRTIGFNPTYHDPLLDGRQRLEPGDPSACRATSKYITCLNSV